MILVKGQPQAGQILVGTKDEKSCFYLVIGVKKKEITELIKKASLLSKENMQRLVLQEAKRNLYVIKIMPVEVTHLTDDYVRLQDEDKTVVRLIKRVQAKTKGSLSSAKPFLLGTLDEYHIINSSIKNTMLRRLTNEVYINLKEVQEMTAKAYKKENNITPSDDLIIREVYCYMGIKTARFYMYLGNDTLYALGNCPNDVGFIKSLYKNLLNSYQMTGGIYTKFRYDTAGRLRGLYNKGTRITLYDTGIRYSNVCLRDRQKEKLKQELHFTDDLIGAVTGV